MIKNIQHYADKKGVETISTSSIGSLFTDAVSDGVTTLEMSKTSFAVFLHYFHTLLPHDWDRKTFWGVNLKVIN